MMVLLIVDVVIIVVRGLNPRFPIEVLTLWGK